MAKFFDIISGIFRDSGLAEIFSSGGWKYPVMYLIIIVLFYLAIVKKFEPLLLLPIAFGMLLANIPSAELFHMDLFISETGEPLNFQQIVERGGLLDFIYLGVKLGIYPPLIFLGIGAMTDFSPLIANPSSLLLGASAQFGIFVAFVGALAFGFTPQEAAAIGIIGGADGPTAIQVTKTLAPNLLGPIAIAAYSYMALVPFIQPPIMRALTTKKERAIMMKQLRPVSRTELIVFPIAVTLIVSVVLPDATPLIGMLMLGNLLKVTGVVDRLSKTAQNELINIVTILLGISVGATAGAENFLNTQTIFIIILGLLAFAFATFGGVLFGKLMCFVTKGKVNPLIGSAGVSAVPMAARVSQSVGQKENPANFLLMHAMGPNVAGVIGSAIAAGVFLNLFK
ncbi:MAG TPA: sodium ion-translocating decarboxylase subunit beta [Bacillota bacterium]|nr:sodium ion-translocating decarboxylase subunit beta [Bacillota bacterium]HOK68825.1 sodium ion-translocating decarboxylase subunit beta [Bacillota bacterium]HPP84898.1 sodium ion-translocating decarboxylase subunit beta [Bacillota bacterium]